MEEKIINRWLKGELSDEELKDFSSSKKYALYRKIMEVSEGFEQPVFEKKQTFKSIENQILIKKEEKSSKVINWSWMYAAASVVLILGMVYFLYPKNTLYETGFGEQLNIVLPDGSEAVLNSRSQIIIENNNWNALRKLNLEGEAFFKVTTGKTFIVKTKTGEVKVLGTQFNVRSNEDFMEVECYEGSVGVTADNSKAQLTKGQAFRKFTNGNIDNWMFKEKEPGWKKGQSCFKSVAIKYVILSMENQYNVQFETDGINLNEKFTGSFTHDNLNIALKTVFEPMKIRFIFTGEKMVRLVKQ